MAYILQFLYFISAAVSCICSTTSFLGRAKRNAIIVKPGNSHFTHETVQSMQTIRIQHDDSGLCLEPVSNTVKAKSCDTGNDNQIFRMMPTAPFQGMLKHISSGRCLSFSSKSDQLVMSSCSARNNALNVWKCHFPFVRRGRNWLEVGWAGLKTVSGTKCIGVTSNFQVRSKDCTIYGKNKEEKFWVFGKKSMGICATAGYLGPRTNDSNYYYLKHPKFAMSWPTKYIEVYMVYNNGMYNAFKSEYGTHTMAMKKIRQHALDSINIVDKMFSKARVRLVLTGFEVWDKKDLANTANVTSSGELHANFKAYSRKLRLQQGKHFDASIHVFDGNLYGAGGTASSAYCRQSHWEVFTIALVTGRNRIKAQALSHVLTHELAHHLRSGHNFDPEYTCPTYHLFGSRCTLGGNEWPKGFSMEELKRLRTAPFSCLNNKPAQSTIVACGNGVIDPGEECDCGKSEACLKRNPCCDGSLCKLRREKSAECSTEKCCFNCKFDYTNGCEAPTTVLSGKDFGQISELSETVNVRKSWKIEVGRGKTITLIMTLMNFEFDEGCPYDYLEVRDGGCSTSALIGRYCRSINAMHVKSTSSQLFVMYKADATFSSHFKLTYTVSARQPNDTKRFLIRNQAMKKCISVGVIKKTATVMSTKCNDEFIWTSNNHIKHVSSGLCLKPHNWYGHFREWNAILLRGDCSDPGAVFILTPGGHIIHAATGYCLRGRDQGRGHDTVIMRCNGSPRTKFSLIERTGPPIVPPTGPPYPPTFKIQHYGKKCFKFNITANVIQLSSACDDVYYFTPKNLLKQGSTGKCVCPGYYEDYARLYLETKCHDGCRFEMTPNGSLRNILTGRCVMPPYGALQPAEGVKIVIHRDCDQLKNKFTLRPGPPLPPTTAAPAPTKTPIPYEFKIQHYGGKKCFKFQSADNKIHLTSSCDDIYYFTSTKLLKHAATGKCVRPASHHDNSLLYLNPRCDDNSKFEMTPFGSLKHIKTGKCVHPLHGKLRPIEGRKVVIYSGCDILRLKFTLVAAPVKTFIIRHYSGLCVSWRPSNNRLWLTTSCNDRFTLLRNKTMKHIKTGKCVIPASTGNNANVVLTSNCADPNTKFEQTGRYSMKHVASGKCVHPYLGALYPPKNWDVVIHGGCDQNRLQFKFVWD